MLYYDHTIAPGVRPLTNDPEFAKAVNEAQEAREVEALKSYFESSRTGDSVDVIAALFDVAAELYNRQGSVPDAWRFEPSPVSVQYVSSMWASEFDGVPSSTLERFGAFLFGLLEEADEEA